MATPANMVRRWLGKPIKTEQSAEHYIQNRSLEKQDLNDQMLNLLKTGSRRRLRKVAVTGQLAKNIASSVKGDPDEIVRRILQTSPEKRVNTLFGKRLEALQPEMAAPRTPESRRALQKKLVEMSDDYIAASTVRQASNPNRSPMPIPVQSVSWSGKANLAPPRPKKAPSMKSFPKPPGKALKPPALKPPPSASK